MRHCEQDEFDQLRERIEALEAQVEDEDGDSLPIGPKAEADHDCKLVYTDYWVNVYEDPDGDFRLVHHGDDVFRNQIPDNVLVTEKNDLHDHITEMVYDD